MLAKLYSLGCWQGPYSVHSLAFVNPVFLLAMVTGIPSAFSWAGPLVPVLTPDYHLGEMRIC